MSACKKPLTLFSLILLLYQVETAEQNEYLPLLPNIDFNDNFFTQDANKVSYDSNLTESSSIFRIAKTINKNNYNNGSVIEPLSIKRKETDNLSNLLRVYNLGVLEKSWLKRNKELTNGCKQNMNVFMEALEKYELWALKVLDASGRYTNGFFWGNNYWTGSETLCHNVGFKRRHYTSSGTFGVLNINDTAADTSSPFPLGFFKIKAELQLPKQLEVKKAVLIGVCAPYSCNEKDMKIILGTSLPHGNGYNSTKVKILDIRTPHNIYYFWKDEIFWVLFCVSSAVALLLIAGTAYDILRVKKYRKVFESHVPISQNFMGGENRKVSLEHVISYRPKCLNEHDSGAVSKLDDNSNTLDAIEGSSVGSDLDFELWEKIILSFSIKKNLKTIFNQNVNVDTLPSIHGLKALSMGWVILGHTCIVIFKYSDNMEFRTAVEKEFIFQAITNGAFSVDTFFFISGLLVSFLYFRTTAKIDVDSLTGTKGIKSKILQFIGLLAYRYGRLTAPYLFVLGVVQVSMKSFYYNSVFDTPTLDHINCPNYWWRNALYINTLFPVSEMCMLWSWYLSDDTQFYVLGIILLILSLSRFKVAATLFLICLGSSWITTAYIAYSNHHLPSKDDPLALFDKIYDKPWTRLGPYLIGMGVGWLLYKTNCKITINKFAIVTSWIITGLVMLTLVFGLYEVNLDLVTSSAYSSLSHSAWALGLGWIVVACSTGCGGFANKILSSSILYPFSRVTYCAYLIHPLVIRYMIINLDSPLHLNKEVALFLFFGQIVASYILSFVISLTFEAPAVSLLSINSPTKTR